MGWTCYRESKTRDEAIDELRRLHTWTSDGRSYSVLADGITGHGDDMGYYAAVAVDEPDQPRRVFASVCLITIAPFGYKDMSEDMGPRIDDCPREVLEQLTELPAAPEVTETQPCWVCNGDGTYTFKKVVNIAPGPHSCWNCDGEGHEPVKDQQDRHKSARRWRADAWARIAAQPELVL